MDPRDWIEENLATAKLLPLEDLIWQVLRAGYHMGVQYATQHPCCRVYPVPDLKPPKPFVDHGAGI